ncbi:MAG: ATP-dependent helicase HrpA [Gammaproteobacteria bacterium]|jgi:ATP-dependent helicase HrpA
MTSLELKNIYDRLAETRSSEWFRLKRDFDRLKKRNLEKNPEWDALMRDIELSVQNKSDRESRLPKCYFDDKLPINQHLDEISAAIKNNPITIICGETGSGKTTQLPKLCLTLGRGIEGVIGHTQPRRLAARTVAKRIAEELDSDLGSHVGFKIRHQDVTSKHSYIKLMTDGILLAELQQDRYLNQYDTLIIDEAHERSLNIDFILGYIKLLIPKRPDLKVIITSATIDVTRFSEHFDNAPIIEVSGRTWPVDVLYRPFEEVDEDEDPVSREVVILQAIRELTSYDMGDILIFMEGEGEIHETDKFLRKQNLRDTDILPLYARLSSSRQNKIFAPHNRRHIVLATNIAETSLTIPGIRYVIDTGMARMSRYSYRSKVQRLPIERVSMAAANQRKGRCGRTSEGICIRLYSEEDFSSRAEYTEPEILRTNLASVILKMKALKIGDIEQYPFINPPDKKFINDGMRLLREINALDKEEKLTPIGRKLVRFPLDPRHARILLAAHDFNCLHEILIIVSALSIQDPRERPIDKQQKADESHKQFSDDDSDFLWFLNLWNFYQKQIKQLSQNKLRKLCQTNFLSYMKMREWIDIHRQLRHVCTEMGLLLNTEPASYQNIHCAILSGMSSHVAFLSDKHEYTGARDIKLNLFPASGQFHKKPKWVVAADLVETSRLFARNVARIDSAWLINVAKHLLKHAYSDAHWDSKSSRVVALEKISLYGMTLIAGKRINYGAINPVESKALFIRNALIEGDLESSASFFKQNNKTIEEVRHLEVKSRRPDILNEEAIYEFYNKSLPAHVYDGQSFAVWSKKLNNEQKQRLCLTKELIVNRETDDITEFTYPDNIEFNGMQLPLEYKFLPGAKEDGLSVDIPLEVLNQFDQNQMDYLVPGLIEEKITLLLKSLPKPIRKRLVPIPETVAECVSNIKNQSNSLKQNLISCLFKTRAVDIAIDDFTEAVLPEHLRTNYRIVDAKNELIAEGDDIVELKNKLATQIEHAFTNLYQDAFGEEEVTSWDFGDLPVEQKVTSKENTITSYPSLLEEDGKVYRYAFDNLRAAEYYLRFGLRGLLKNALAKEIKYLRKNLRGIEKLALLYTRFGNKDELVESIINLVLDETFLYEKKMIRKQEQFLAALEQGRAELIGNADRICVVLQKILEMNLQVQTLLSDAGMLKYSHAVKDIEEQLEYMMFHGFIEDIETEYLKQYPRYLEAIIKRMEKFEHGVDKDRQSTKQIKPHWDRIKKLVDHAYETDGNTTSFDAYRWMCEELRISLFAQGLKTRMPVSLKRIDKAWERCQKEN